MVGGLWGRKGVGNKSHGPLSLPLIECLLRVFTRTQWIVPFFDLGLNACLFPVLYLGPSGRGPIGHLTLYHGKTQTIKCKGLKSIYIADVWNQFKGS